MGALHVMDPKQGDLKVIWDSENEDEVKLAENQFDEAKKKGFLAFKVKKSGNKGEQIEKFDPDSEKIIMTPPIAGG